VTSHFNKEAQEGVSTGEVTPQSAMKTKNLEKLGDKKGKKNLCTRGEKKSFSTISSQDFRDESHCAGMQHE